MISSKPIKVFLQKNNLKKFKKINPMVKLIINFIRLYRFK